MRSIITLFFFLYLITQSFAINPEINYPYKPESFGIKNYSTNFITTKDNIKLISWHFRPLKKLSSKITVIIACGDSGNMSYSLFYVKKLLDMGVQVVTFDYRGFGKSGPFPIDNNYLYYSQFVDDLRAVIQHTKKRSSNSEKIGLMCFSMGTIITTLVAGLEKMDFIIAENFVCNPDKVVKRLDSINQRKFLLPKNNPSDFESLVNKISCPMLLFVSQIDLITTREDSKAIASQMMGREMVEYNGNHGEGLTSLSQNSTGGLYFKYISDFLKL